MSQDGAKARELVPVYQRMSDTVTEEAANRYEKLGRACPRVSRMDLRIGAIAMSCNAILVTRNLRDFGAIEALAVVDWSRN